MGKTRIEWCNYSINPVKGLCPMACPYCYARKLYKRFGWNPNITFNLDAFQPLMKVKEPSKIFVGSTMELFGNWVQREWMIDILSMCNAFKQHTFIFLTKQPQNLIKWSPFPDNCWVGVSATNEMQFKSGVLGLQPINAKVKFISFEPLLHTIGSPTAQLRASNTLSNGQAQDIYYFLKDTGIDWVIIGQQTPINPKTQPKYEWIKDIIEACANANIPYFLKNNLENVIPKQAYADDKLIQQFPNGGK